MKDRSLCAGEPGRIGAVLPAVAIPCPVALVQLAPVAAEDLRRQRLEPGQGVVPRARRPVAARQQAAFTEIPLEGIERIGAGQERELVVDGAGRVR